MTNHEIADRVLRAIEAYKRFSPDGDIAVAMSNDIFIPLAFQAPEQILVTPEGHEFFGYQSMCLRAVSNTVIVGRKAEIFRMNELP